jgi:hypothetical protein
MTRASVAWRVARVKRYSRCVGSGCIEANNKVVQPRSGSAAGDWQVAILSSMVAATMGQELTLALNEWEHTPYDGTAASAAALAPPQRTSPPCEPAAVPTVAFSPCGVGARSRAP